MGKKKGLNHVQAERNEAKSYFKFMKFKILFVLFGCFILSYFYIFCCENPVSDNQLQRDILLVFLPTLATILIPVFLISSSVIIKEYPSFKKKGISLYIILMVFIMVFQLLSLLNIIPLAEKVFKICVILFVFSLLLLIPYVLLFIHSNVSAVLTRLFRFSVRPFIKSNKRVNTKIIEETNRKIAYMGHLIMHTIHEYDYNTFSIGLEKLNAIGKIILESPRCNEKTLNDIYKNIITNYQYISCECASVELEKYMGKAAFNISDLIKFGMSSKNRIASKIDFPILIKELEKVGVISVENNMHSSGREIIGHLGQIGEISLKKNFEVPPEIQVLSSLQEIGIICAEKKMENLCIETFIRIESLGRESAVLIEANVDLERKKEIEKIFKRALSSHWIVSAHMFKHIPESGEWLKKFRIELEQEFEDSFGNAYNHALNEMELISSVGVKVLLDYKKAVSKTQGR